MVHGAKWCHIKTDQVHLFVSFVNRHTFILRSVLEWDENSSLLPVTVNKKLSCVDLAWIEPGEEVNMQTVLTSWHYWLHNALCWGSALTVCGVLCTGLGTESLNVSIKWVSHTEGALSRGNRVNLGRAWAKDIVYVWGAESHSISFSLLASVSFHPSFWFILVSPPCSLQAFYIGLSLLNILYLFPYLLPPSWRSL